MTEQNELNINYYIEKFPNISFVKSDENDLSEFNVVPTLEDILEDANTLDYIETFMNDDEATEYVLRIIISSYIKGVTDSLFELAEQDAKENGTSVNEEALEFQLNVLKAIGDCLINDESEEATALRNACTCEKFNQLILFNRFNGNVFFIEDTDKSSEDFQKAVDLADSIFMSTFSAMMDEYAEEMKEELEENETSYVA